MSIVKKYEDFIAENWGISTLFNTPGIGNMAAAATISLDEAGPTKELDRFRPNGNYQNRGWIAPNFSDYMDVKQSNTRFQIGDTVACIDKSKDTYGMIGKIIAFEDNTIRWESLASATGIGQNAEQYRCHAAMLVRVTLSPTGTTM